jgi:ferredoxin
MIYAQGTYIAIILLVTLCKDAASFRSITTHSQIFSSSRHFAVPQWLQGGDLAESVSLQTLTVKFINTPSGEDVIVENVVEGVNLLALGDEHGVKLPRACRTGLCGSCTCEVMDPAAIQTDTNPRAGFATIRACSTKCAVPPGMTEMIVDVGRMRKVKKTRGDKGLGGAIVNDEDDDNADYMDPMARFGDNWEVDFKKNTKMNASQCRRCDNGLVLCMHCDGAGKVIMGFEQQYRSTCAICLGSGHVRCGYCQGKGTASRKA